MKPGGIFLSFFFRELPFNFEHMKKEIEIPENWNEISQKQFRYLLRRYWKMVHDSDIELIDLKRDFASYLIGREQAWVLNRRLRYLTAVNNIAHRLDWLFEINDNQISLNVNTTRNLLPEYKGLRGPKDFGTDIRFGEFRVAVDILNAYNEQQDDEILDTLAGTLYRQKSKNTNKPGFDGNFREQFSLYNLEVYAENVKKWPVWVKYGIYLWFANFCKFLINDTFIIEGREVCFAPVFGSGNTDEKKGDNLGMLSILFTMADSGTFGNVEQTDKAPLIDVMLKLLNDHYTAVALKNQK